MKKLLIYSPWLFLFLLISKKGEPTVSFHPLFFESHFLFVTKLQESGESFSGQISWTPHLHWDSLFLRAELGVSILKNAFQDRFLILDYELLSRFPLFFSRQWDWEVGAGFQTWTAGNGGTNPILSLNLGWHLPSSWLDRIFLGSSYLFLDQGVIQGKLGVGVKL